MVHLFSESGQFEPITIVLASHVVARDGYFSQSGTLTNPPHARIHSDLQLRVATVNKRKLPYLEPKMTLHEGEIIGFKTYESLASTPHP